MPDRARPVYARRRSRFADWSRRTRALLQITPSMQTCAGWAALCLLSIPALCDTVNGAMPDFPRVAVQGTPRVLSASQPRRYGIAPPGRDHLCGFVGFLA